MLPNLATLIAVYAAARLIQVVIEYKPSEEEQKGKLDSAPRVLHAAISFAALLAIFYFWRAIQEAAGRVDFDGPRFR